MLFLVIGRAYENAGVPQPQELALVKAGLEAFKQDPKLKTFYLFVGERGGVGIWDVNSAEELHRAIAENPIGRLASWEIHPLVTVDQGLASINVVEQRMAQMAQGAAR
ncbi:MAG: hypothetical protein HY689_04050 [Chloroflexi bacterium]|nr:hypothetical protein [Chloroflexota bacterium]